MFETRIGCSGWSYKAWVGPFYPNNSEASDYLSLYSRSFDTVEIDSTFYSEPASTAVEKWKGSTPPGFVFSPKMPRQITHEKRLSMVEEETASFLKKISHLKEKLGPILIQFPPSFNYQEGFANFRSFISNLPQKSAFAVEFRDNSWFRDDTYALLEDSAITLAWSEIPWVKANPHLTTSTVYLRLVGDRSIREENFGKIQRDRSKVINRWAETLNGKADDIKRAFVYSNNHFQGFGPGTVNLFRLAMGLDAVDWKSRIKATVPEGQKTLF